MTNPTEPPPPGQQAGYPPHPGSTSPPPQFQQPPPPGYTPDPQGYGPPAAPLPKKDRGNKVVLIILAVIFGGIVLLCGLGSVLVANAPRTTTTLAAASPEPAQGAAPTEPAAPTTPPAPTEPPKPKYSGSGTLVVGSDIPPGRYRGNLDGGSCYWERMKSFDGAGVDSIIANDNVNGPTVIEVAPTDAGLKGNRCGEWTPATDPLTLPNRAPGGDGVFIVGLDIDPGTYRSSGASGCYWERLRSFSQAGIESTIANDNAKGPAVVKIAAGDAGFKTSRCGSWERIG